MDKNEGSLENVSDTERLTAKQASEILGISLASVRNWTRYGYLQPEDSDRRYFQMGDVLNLKKAIADGKIQRLRKRANKAGADRMFAPVEYIDGEGDQKQVIALIDYLLHHHVDRRVAVFLLSLNLFRAREDISCHDLQHILTFPPDIFRRSGVYLELKDFFLDIQEYFQQDKLNHDVAIFLFNLPLPARCEVLGIVYQALSLERNKARFGSYFTPAEIVKAAVQDHIQKGQKLLDPCCGTGQFLLAFARNSDDPENIWGMDLDLNAVRIARLNLLLHYEQDFRPNIFHDDTLNHAASQHAVCIPPVAYDFIATNPPWGADIDSNIINKLALAFPEITSGESFSYFLRVSITLLRDGGTGSFILPEALLNIRLHGDIREYLLKNCQITMIEYLGRRFRNVFSAVIRMDIRKRKPLNKDVLIKFPDKEYRISQKRFLDNQWFVMDIHLSKQDEVILRKIYKMRHNTLKDKADWALGIVTGDNSRYLSRTRELNMEPIYRGADVEKYVLKEPSFYIGFIPKEFQQVAPEWKYRVQEKLIYRFISNQLVFAYDIHASLTLNSANILIPRPGSYPVKVILALFNSNLYQFIYLKKYHTLKILRGDLEQLPLPLWSKDVFDHIEELADKLITGEECSAELDEYIMAQFGLNTEECLYIKTNSGYQND